MNILATGRRTTKKIARQQTPPWALDRVSSLLIEPQSSQPEPQGPNTRTPGERHPRGMPVLGIHHDIVQFRSLCVHPPGCKCFLQHP